MHVLYMNVTMACSREIKQLSLIIIIVIWSSLYNGWQLKIERKNKRKKERERGREREREREKEIWRQSQRGR